MSTEVCEVWVAGCQSVTRRLSQDKCRRALRKSRRLACRQRADSDLGHSDSGLEAAAVSGSSYDVSAMIS